MNTIPATIRSLRGYYNPRTILKTAASWVGTTGVKIMFEDERIFVISDKQPEPKQDEILYIFGDGTPFVSIPII